VEASGVTNVVAYASYYSHGVERTLDKLPLRGQDRSPSKYTNCGVCVILESKVCPLEFP
jgi:hypothetical protein